MAAKTCFKTLCVTRGVAGASFLQILEEGGCFYLSSRIPLKSSSDIREIDFHPRSVRIPVVGYGSDK